ncbi:MULTISPECIES: AAA family ATPase [Cyanophyceae]|uniref:AAA family ATPase n=1 Tax=Cyanophyceae TaxID=3028117 RepID=UPI00168559BB|nr:AAA family ATPase [Trichocoleus sp. FACHB-69]MBD1932576.1 ParA family protein [Trichocoleus sp. FACHB-69]
MPKIISLFNQAGGTGKTTLTQNLGYQLTQRGHNVLLVDIDPQASLTAFMGLEPFELSQTIADALLKDAPLPVHRQLHGMDLVPSNILLSAAEVQLHSALAREWRLKQVLSSVQNNYNFILVDCPPTLGIFSIVSLVASTHVLVPIQTHFKAFLGVELLLDSIRQVRERINPELAIIGVVPMMHESRTSQGKVILDGIKEQLGRVAPIFPAIPRAIAFADASMERKPLAVYDPKHPAVPLLEFIAQRLEKD